MSISFKFFIYFFDVFFDDCQMLMDGYNFFDKFIDMGLDSFVYELRWMVEMIFIRQV